MPSVMIAEDDLFMADMLEEVLVDGGYEVCGIARTVEQAIELGERHKPDLAVLDIRLAEGGYGMEIAARLKQQRPLGVLYASGQVGKMVLTKSDGDALLVKPYRPEDIVRALKIVEQIVSTGNASQRFPKGFSVLNGSGKHDSAAGTSNIELTAQNTRLRRQQSELAQFGKFALGERNLQLILVEATHICVACFGVGYAGIYRYRPEGNDLIVEAGVGWDQGVIGHAILRADGSSPHGRAFVSRTPVICDDLTMDPSFVLPRIYTRHGIVTTLDVVIGNNYQPIGVPYGVLEVASTAQHNYDHYDIEFLTGIANIVATAVDTENRSAALRFAAVRLQEMDDDRERIKRSKIALLDEKRRIVNEQAILVQQVQHSVRNNLQLVYAMLSKQLLTTTDAAGKAGISAIARRVMTLAQLYHHVLHNGSSQVIDFSTYLSAICADFESLEGDRNPQVTLSCLAEPVILDLDSLTVLGCVTSELIAGAYAHAPPDSPVTIGVSLHLGPSGDEATLTFSIDSDAVPATANDNQHEVEMVKRLLRQVGGTATLRSDHGVEWTLTFPAPPGPTPASPVAQVKA
jgi:two-component sensor histidine kinase/DNA-binding response OmpR family regulator